jgi:Skp family chaperone for outer membrane proteins
MKVLKEKYFNRILMITLLALLVFTASAGYRQITADASQVGGSGRSLEIGYIDSDKYFEEFPEFIKFMQDKEKKSVEIRNLYKSGKQLTKEQAEDIAKETAKYMEMENNHLKVFVDVVTEASRRVADEKKLDIIFNNKSSGRVLEYGGINVTEEVRTKIREINQSKNKPEEQAQKTDAAKPTP